MLCVGVYVRGGVIKVAHSSSYFEKFEWYLGKINNLFNEVVITCGVLGDLQRKSKVLEAGCESFIFQILIVS